MNAASHIKLVLRIFIVLFLGWFSVFLLFERDLMLFIWPALLTIGLIAELIRFLQKEKREVYYFLLALKENIFSETTLGPPCTPEIIQAAGALKKRVKDLSEQKTINHIFLEHVTEHIDSGLICYDNTHHVRFINKSACNILHRKTLLNVDNLKYRHRQLFNALTQPDTYHDKILNYHTNTSYYALLIKSVKFDIMEHRYTLVSFKDIKEPLNEREIDAWRNLVRYLSHEILNSVIPIANLSDYVRQQLTTPSHNENPQELMECLETVSHRCKGLVGTVNSARQLSHLPKPSIREFPVRNLFKRVLNLLQTKLDKRHITVCTNLVHHEIKLHGDFDLIEQVLINLLNNAMDALKNTEIPKICLSCTRKNNTTIMIGVEDNGPGIPTDKMNQIFVPFYTTKKHGTGIGLSLSRQIMQLHKGSLNVLSQPGKTLFMLMFE